MFDHVSIGVRDIGIAQTFYDAVLTPLGYGRQFTSDGVLGYGPDRIGFWVAKVESPVVPDMRSGLHFCFIAPSDQAVDDFYARGIANGGTDNGPPGIRPEYGQFYYAAFMIDPDGYRLEAYFKREEEAGWE